jgi:hypothetical protein
MDQLLDLTTRIKMTEGECEADLTIGGMVHKTTFRAYVDAVDNLMEFLKQASVAWPASDNGPDTADNTESHTPTRERNQ